MNKGCGKEGWDGNENLLICGENSICDDCSREETK